MGCRGHAAGDHEGLERAERREIDRLELGERGHLHQPAAADERGLAVVLVREAVHVERELVVPGRLRVLRQAAVVQVHLAGNVQQVHHVDTHVVDQAGTHAAVGDDAHARRAGAVVQGELRPDDVGVAAEVAEADTVRDAGLGDAEIVEVGHSAEDDRGASEGRLHGRGVGGGAGDRLGHLAAHELVDAGGGPARRLGVGVGHDDPGGAAEAGEVVRGRGALPPRAEDHVAEAGGFLHGPGVHQRPIGGWLADRSRASASRSPALRATARSRMAAWRAARSQSFSSAASVRPGSSRWA